MHKPRNPTTPAAPMHIEQILEGLRYPAAKEQVVAHARQHDAPLNVLHVLDQLPAGEWHSTLDLMKSIRSVDLRGDVGS